MNKVGDTVDIIIPVYNGYEDIQRCMDSVKKYTDIGRHRILLINDCSPDERIKPYLDSLAAENIIILHNESNQGFSMNINKGMTDSDRDVILLNADTIVTKGWIDKLQSCAYRSSRTATVTPLSNSATLCSVPVICQDNQVPENVTIDEYAELIERCSLKRYPRITVAIGFCMYVKQQIVEEVGLFDAVTFERGYGEENDFCNRAEQLGYQHVMCDDTFIYHRGTASFETAEKQALCDAHNKILEERYPQQMKNNHLYCLNNPDQEIRDNINLYTKLYTGRKNILYLIHLDFQSEAFNNIGGTQLHVKDLVMAFKEEYNVFVAARDIECLRVTAYTADGETITLKFDIGEAEDFPVFHDEKIARVYEEVLWAFQIDMIHVHHTQDLTLDIYTVADRLGIPTVATLHDYYYVSPTIKLLDENNHYCEPLDIKRTEDSIHAVCGIAPQVSYLEKWRRENEQALRLCERLIFPSESAKDIVMSVFPALQEKAMVITHGSDFVENTKIKEELRSSFENTRIEDGTREFEKTKRIKTHLDQVPGSNRGFNYVTGWAYLEGIDNREVTLYLEVVDCKGAIFYVPLSKKARPDVVNITGKPEVLWCGVHSVFSIQGMAEGKCKLRLIFAAEGKYYTDNHIYTGNYKKEQGKPDRLNVAFIGGMVPAKGSQLVYEILQKENKDINWFIMGAIGDDCLMELTDKEDAYFSNVYEKDDIFELLRTSKIDVVCIMSSWPETFCYTVSESWLSGIPVIGTDIGAIGERIRKTGAGWTVDVGVTADELLQLLMTIKENPEELEAKRAIVQDLKIKTIDEMCQDYRDFYQEFSKVQKKEMVEQAVDFDFIFQGLALANPKISGNGTVASLNSLKQENKRLKFAMEAMQHTTSYRMAKRIAAANVPFKESLKKLLKKR